MRNTLFNGYEGPRLPRDVQIKRLKRVIEAELTPCQKQTLTAYYFEKQTIPQIAAARGVQKSTVSRTLKRAEDRLRKYLRY